MHKALAIRCALFACIIFAILIRWDYREEDDSWLQRFENKKSEFSGIVKDDPDLRDGWQRFTVEVSPHHFLFLRSQGTDFSYGDKINFSAKIQKPEIIVSEDGREFDYRSYLSKDGIYYIAKTYDAERISNIFENKKSSLLVHYLYKLKNGFLDNLNHSLPSPQSFLAGGLVISGKGSLDKELQEDFQRVGLIHIVVLSGFNISIVGEAIMRTLSFLPKFAGGFIGGFFIILFSIMTGGGATVVRSAIMSIIAIFARLTGRLNSALMSLFVAGSIMLIHNPKLAFYDPSFQLSFVATLGLILFAEPIELFFRKIISRRRSNYEPGAFASSVLSLVSSTLATQIFTLPLIMRFSGVVSLIALPVNMIVLPLIPATMLFVFITGISGFISGFAAILPAFVSHALLSYELAVVRYFASFSLSAIKLGTMSKLYVFLSYFVLLNIYFFMRNMRGRKYVATSDETFVDQSKIGEPAPLIASPPT